MADSFRQTLTLGDAQKLTGPRVFNIMMKPAGSLCNLGCAYCYYLDKAEIYGGREPRMSLEMLETAVRGYIEANDVPEVTFIWHGGEPMVLGLDFYRKAMEFQQRYAGGKTIHNTLQTNGTLITREWAHFFKEHDFLLGVSLDGPQDIHDKFRRDKGGAPTFDKVMHGIELLSAEGVPFNTMSTVNAACEGRGLEVYRFLKGIGSRYLQFMPVVEHVLRGSRPWIVDPDTPGAVLARWSVSDVGFGRFLCDIFDEWVRQDVGACFVNLFDTTLAGWCGVPPGTCAYADTCGDNAILEHNGDLYPCDHFVYPKYRLGNIREHSIAELMDSEKMVQFGLAKRTALPRRCRTCEFVQLCHGECPKHRFNRTEAGETGLNALCAGYRMFYAHSAPYMLKMRELLARDLAPALVMPWARERKSLRLTVPR